MSFRMQPRRYKMVSDTIGWRLEAKVQELLQAGWEPHGNPFVAGKTIYQALVSQAKIYEDMSR